MDISDRPRVIRRWKLTEAEDPRKKRLLEDVLGEEDLTWLLFLDIDAAMADDEEKDIHCPTCGTHLVTI